MLESKKIEIMDKIKKLFALSKSSNQHEAALAMAKAKELLMKYEISESELDEALLKKEYNKSNVTTELLKFYTYKRITNYKDWIITHIGRFFGCDVFRDAPLIYKNNKSNKFEYYKCMEYVGFPLDVQIASFVAEQVLRFLDDKFKYYKKQFKGTYKIDKNFKESYVYGVINVLNEKMEHLIQYKMKNETSKYNISKYDKLLAIKENAIVEYVKEQFGIGAKYKENELVVNSDIVDLGKNDATSELHINAGLDSNNNFCNIGQLQ